VLSQLLQEAMKNPCNPVKHKYRNLDRIYRIYRIYRIIIFAFPDEKRKS